MTNAFEFWVDYKKFIYLIHAKFPKLTYQYFTKI